jgi:hypothetical protein
MLSAVSRPIAGSRRCTSLFKAVMAGVAALGFSSQALASCYTPKEAAAEQAIRAHSELMVVGLTCASYFNEPLLFNRYAIFTNQHLQDIQAHEKVMIDYFAKTAEGNPKRRFDHWRTSIANAVSTRAALSSALFTAVRNKIFLRRWKFRQFRAVACLVFLPQHRKRRW